MNEGAHMQNSEINSDPDRSVSVSGERDQRAEGKLPFVQPVIWTLSGEMGVPPDVVSEWSGKGNVGPTEGDAGATTLARLFRAGTIAAQPVAE